MQVTTLDYHTGGEPFRIVTGGAPEPVGEDVLSRRQWVAENIDEFRRLLVNEPRGHPDMYGCYVVPPDDPGADFGAIFFHKDGYSLACGHGTMALGAWAVESARVAAPADGETEVVIDVPSGRVRARVRSQAGKVHSITFQNVAAYVSGRGVEVETTAGRVKADLSWGGAAYASVRAGDLGLEVTPEALPALIDVGRQIKWALNDHPAARHPQDDRQSGVYGTILWETVEGGGPGLHQRNVAVFADGQVDRSPCGSGTSARLALLDESGELAGETLIHSGIVGSVFRGRVVERVSAYGNPAVITEIEGTSYPTGHHRFLLDPDDELGTGFQLR